MFGFPLVLIGRLRQSFYSHVVHGAEETASVTRAVLNYFFVLPTSVFTSSYTLPLFAPSHSHMVTAYVFSVPHSFWLHFLFFVKELAYILCNFKTNEELYVVFSHNKQQ